VAQHLTPEYVYQPRYTEHSNGTYRLSDAVIVADDLAPLSVAYAGFLGRRHSPHGSGVRFEIGDSFALHIVRAGEAARTLPGTLLPPIPGIAGMVFRTKNLLKVKERLKAQGFPFAESDGGVTVPGEEAGGVAVQFRA
ncbi:MAG: hypothetical protein ACRDGM_17895, partial [bacterium]